MKEFLKTWGLEILVFVGLTAGFIAVLLMTGCSWPARRAAGVVTPPKETFTTISHSLNWLVTLSIMGIGASVAAAIFLPIKGLACAAAGGFATVLGLALIIPAIAPYLPWFALALVVAATGAAIWYFRKYVLATSCAVEFGKDMSKALTDEEAAVVKALHAGKQIKLGVKGLIDQTIAKVK